MVKQQMEMSRDLEDQAILFLSITLIQRDKILMFDEDQSSDKIINMQESCKDTSKYLLSYLLFVLIYIPYIYVQESINKQHKLEFFL